MDLDVHLTVDELLEREATQEVREDYLNARVPRSLMTQLKLMAWYLTEKRRQSRKASRTISRGDVVVRILSAAVASIWKDEGLSAEPTKAEVEAHLKNTRNN